MPRFQISQHEDERELWRAKNATVEGNYLVTVTLGFGQDANPAEKFKAALVKLGREATLGKQLSKYCWLFALDLRLNVVMQTLVDHLGVDHNSFTVVDLKSGEGLAYDAEKRIVSEFYSKNLMA